MANFGYYSNPLLKENRAVDATKKENTKEAARYDHPQDVKPLVTYDTVSLHEEASGDEQSVTGVTNSIYEEIPNRAYDGLPNPSYDTPQLPTKIDHS